MTDDIIKRLRDAIAAGPTPQWPQSRPTASSTQQGASDMKRNGERPEGRAMRWARVHADALGGVATWVVVGVLGVMLGWALAS